MNFYPHHIGDYLTATAHLTWLEDCSYRRLLDVYYSREQAIPSEISQACRLVRATSKDERKAVDTVLHEFFMLTDTGWSHGRCDEEIQKAKVAAARSRANGMSGGRPAKQNPPITQQVISGFPKETYEEPDPKAPITNPITNTKVIPPKPPKGGGEGFEEFYAAYPRKEARLLALKAFQKVTAPLPDLLAALAWQRGRSEWTKEGGKFIPLPASWLNAERWKDERPAFQPGDAPAWYETRAGIERKAASLGIGKYNESEEQFPTYKSRVMTAAKEKSVSFGMDLEQLSSMNASH